MRRGALGVNTLTMLKCFIRKQLTASELAELVGKPVDYCKQECYRNEYRGLLRSFKHGHARYYELATGGRRVLYESDPECFNHERIIPEADERPGLLLPLRVPERK